MCQILKFRPREKDTGYPVVFITNWIPITVQGPEVFRMCRMEFQLITWLAAANKQSIITGNENALLKNIS